MKKQSILSVLAAALLLFSMLAPSGCSYDSGILSIEPPDVDTTIQVSFSEDILPLFEELKCNISGCHSTGGTSPDLSPANAYDELIQGGYINAEKPADSELMQWLLGNRAQPMPLSGPDDILNEKVLAWIIQGAKDN
ncbi:MAG: hypothetical protein KDC66_16645 [Phaeodactylibacter sp.]|nr:hypothetical protein [Phaeodactylibacter sp.]MCB9274998.1 hypothetical protein [Lewinellaceae bacterium]